MSRKSLVEKVNKSLSSLCFWWVERFLYFLFLSFVGCHLLYCDDDCIGLFLYFCITSIFIVLIITKFQLGKLFVNKLACTCGVWCGVVWCGVVWCGVVWCGVVWCGVVWCGVVWCGVVWCGVVWCGVVCGLTCVVR